MAFFQKENKNPPVSSGALLKQIKVLEERIEETTQEVKELKREMKKAVTNIGIVRFNPFKEIGGDQSFSIAFLNAENDGVVVTSYYGREMNRVYAKHVKKGKSESMLAQEETEAIARAITQEDSKPQTLKTESAK